jgi:hypothetical protein
VHRPELAAFWQPIEAAAESAASASSQALPEILADLVEMLGSDLVPRLFAEERVLVPLVSTDQESQRAVGLRSTDVSRLAETISSRSFRPTDSDAERVRRTASMLCRVLEEQRLAERGLVTRVCALPAAGPGARLIGVGLEREAKASRASQVFVKEADRLPTEAWALRHNPKSPRMRRPSPARSSPVADLVAIIEFQGGRP